MNKKTRTIWKCLFTIIGCFTLLALVINYVYVDSSWLNDLLGNESIITEVDSLQFGGN